MYCGRRFRLIDTLPFLEARDRKKKEEEELKLVQACVVVASKKETLRDRILAFIEVQREIAKDEKDGIQATIEKKTKLFNDLMDVQKELSPVVETYDTLQEKLTEAIDWISATPTVQTTASKRGLSSETAFNLMNKSWTFTKMTLFIIIVLFVALSCYHLLCTDDDKKTIGVNKANFITSFLPFGCVEVFHKLPFHTRMMIMGSVGILMSFFGIFL